MKKSIDDVLKRQINVLQAKVEYLQNELVAEREKHEAAEFWNNCVYPEGMKSEDVQNELKDYHVMLENVGRVYDRVTGGMISKPNTLASSVIAVYDDRMTEHYNQAIQDVKEEISEVLQGMIG